MHTNKSKISFISLALASLSVRSVNGGWIDPDTPEDKRTIKSLVDGTDYDLVMSDEFNVQGRSFKDGDDPTWTALDKSDDDSSAAGGGSLQFYNSSMVTTNKDGYLEIKSILSDTEWRRLDPIKHEYEDVTKHFKSGMVQSWNKFCFTGGIMEVDVIFPGDAYIGGLWPAVWLLGNLGRATYEGSTNNIWPWSYDTCDRKKQQAQSISACNAQNHFGMNSFQGRGATEIDLIEVMTGKDEGPLPSTVPGVSYPYADFTLQVAPGIKENRPESGFQPVREASFTKSGFTEFLAQSWYEGLEINGNTTLNPYFYGTYLGETKPQEPVHRNKKQVFQADAVGAMHQLTPPNFKTMHTFRIEWQPGPGGRLDWYAKDHRVNSTHSTSGDGHGQDWVHAFSIKGESLNITGAQIPVEPSAVILNTGISSTWGFPFTTAPGCVKCFDCMNTTCACNFHAGFCNMMKSSTVAMYIDHVRVYQSKNHSAHVGIPHTVGCDPVEYPTKAYIKGNEYRYMRAAPFVYDDKGPLEKKIRNGGGKCKLNTDCGGVNTDKNTGKGGGNIRGECTQGEFSQGLFNPAIQEGRCKCFDGFTGPKCLADDKHDDEMGAWELGKNSALFEYLPKPALPLVLVASVSFSIVCTVLFALGHVVRNQKELKSLQRGQYQKIPAAE